MDEELKNHLDGMETRIVTRIEAMETRMGTVETRMGTMETRMEAMTTRIEARISEECHNLETKLLTEFWKCGRQSDMRTREALATANSVSERLTAIEDRVSELERKRAS